jgi:hypothetical protein
VITDYNLPSVLLACLYGYNVYLNDRGILSLCHPFRQIVFSFQAVECTVGAVPCRNRALS